MATRRCFTQEYQDQAVSLVLHSGRTIRDVAKSIGVHEITLGKWVNKAKGSDSDRDKELATFAPAPRFKPNPTEGIPLIEAVSGMR